MPRESAKTPLEPDFSRTRDDDRELAELVRRQHGVVSRQQLAEAGFLRDAITVRLRAGRLHRVHAGVYSVTPRPLIPRHGRWMAAVLASGADALLSHWSAAALWGIRPNGRSRVDVTVAHRSRSSRAIHRHVSSVPEDERAVHEGIPEPEAVASDLRRLLLGDR